MWPPGHSLSVAFRLLGPCVLALLTPHPTRSPHTAMCLRSQPTCHSQGETPLVCGAVFSSRHGLKGLELTLPTLPTPSPQAHHPSLKAVKPSPCAWSEDKAHAPHWSRVPMRFLMECFPKASRQALPQLRAGSAPGAPAADGDASLITDGLSVPRIPSDSRPF